MGDRMIRLNGGKPGDERGFVHKKLLGGISKIAGVASFIPGASTVSAITGSLAGRGRTVPRSQTARPSVFSRAEKNFGRKVKFESESAGPSLGERLLGLGGRIIGGEISKRRGRPAALGIGPPQIPGIIQSGDCGPGLVLSDLGCVAVDSPVGAQFAGGQAVMGRYGAGMVAGSQIVDRATCLRGMQLGNDGLCYNKGQITNKQRMWPAGRKPLLTGGEMGAISTAARAGRRMELATKRLQKMGMMKKPSPRQATLAGHRATLVHDSKH